MRKLKSTDCETSLNFTERRKRGPQTLKQRLSRARRAVVKTSERDSSTVRMHLARELATRIFN